MTTVQESGEASQPQDAAMEGTVLAKLHKHVIPWLFMVGLLCYLDRTNLSFGALQLNEDLRFTCAVYGFGAGIFFIGYAVFQVPLTAVAHRADAATWLAVISLVWGLLTVALAFVRGPATFYVVRFLLGVAESSTYPTMWTVLARFFAPAHMSSAYARVCSCSTVAQVFGAPLAALILGLTGFLGLRGWQWLFVIGGKSCQAEGGGAMTVLYALVLKSRLARDPQSARFLTNAESAWLAARLSQGAEENDSRRLSGPAVMWEVARDWRVLYLAVTWVLAASSMFGIMFWAPLLIRELIGGPHRGLLEEPEAFCGERGHASSSALVALLTTVPYAAAAVSTVVVAHHADLRRERRRHAGVPLVVGGLFLAATPLVRRGLGPAAGFACLVLAAGVTWGFQGPFFTWPAVFLRGGSAGSAGFALINSVGSLGGFLGPYAIGLITQRAPGGLAAPMLFMAGLLLAAGVAVLLFPVPDQRPQLSSSSDVECARLVGQEDDEDGAPAVADDSPNQSLDREIEPPRLASRARQR